jgi:ParB/RepB/Spo0J family partition protein
MARDATPLQEIDPDRIKQNPDNPRLIFREDEMNDLLESIREVGIKVPLSVYPDASKFVLIDGERRWRCAKKLNLSSVPAIVQPKPTRLENLLMMFNIHNVRVDWDLMPMSIKLGEIRSMLEAEGRATTPKALAAITGVRPATVRRALELLELPKQYQRMLLREAEKPRNEQRIKVDLFLEVYKSLHAIERHAPEVFEVITTDDYVRSMVDKYVDGVVDNVVSYRDVSKIARAELAGADKVEAVPVIVRLVEEKKYSIQQAFEDTVQRAYEQRDLLTRLTSLTDKLATFKTKAALKPDVRNALRALRSRIDHLLGD